MTDKTTNSGAATRQNPKDKKRAEALRQNLLKRKQQARDRKEEK